MSGTIVRQTLSCLSLVMMIYAISACSTPREQDEIADDEFRTLPGRFAEEETSDSLVAVEAYIGENNFFISYESEDGLIYSGGEWSNRIDLPALRQMILSFRTISFSDREDLKSPTSHDHAAHIIDAASHSLN